MTSLTKAELKLKRAVAAYNKVTTSPQHEKALISVKYDDGSRDSFVVPTCMVDIVANSIADARANFWTVRVEYNGEKYELEPYREGHSYWHTMNSKQGAAS